MKFILLALVVLNSCDRKEESMPESLQLNKTKPTPNYLKQEKKEGCPHEEELKNEDSLESLSGGGSGGCSVH